ncbi:hypothetical protein DPX16_17850 [Anabarilius grahami]|uniref:Uncharacterized protein n=1 Tax=Anabarilius grahami TaxID=495550 RepID=A0A3N0YG66_ANAGA|nr:hypothetical protein DPX16_17850 [Anabarilius grahami]
MLYSELFTSLDWAMAPLSTPMNLQRSGDTTATPGSFQKTPSLQAISNKQATMCIDETVRKDSIQVSGSTNEDDLKEPKGLQVSESKAAATFHIDGAHLQAIPTVGEREAGQPASRPSTPSATDDSIEELSKADNVNVDVLLDLDPDPSN